MMQTHEREPLWVIVSLLGGLNLIAAAFVFMFLYHVPYRAVPKSAMMLVASFLLYFLTRYSTASPFFAARLFSLQASTHSPREQTVTALHLSGCRFMCSHSMLAR